VDQLCPTSPATPIAATVTTGGGCIIGFLESAAAAVAAVNLTEWVGQHAALVIDAANIARQPQSIDIR
jgi:hypothetical protein